MKVFSYIFAALFMVVFAAGCGNNNQPNCAPGQIAVNGSCQMANPYGYGVTNGYGATSCQGTCSPGYVQTSAGCLTQGTCSPCMGYSNGSCLPATALNYNGTSGYPYGTGGYPYGTTGYPYGTTGYPYGTTGYPYGTTGYPYGYIP